MGTRRTLAAKDAAGSWQQRSCKCSSVVAVEVDVDQAAASLAKKHPDVDGAVSEATAEFIVRWFEVPPTGDTSF